MGCILSYCKKNDQSDQETLLITNKYCFVCGRHFSNNVDYNKHIPRCNYDNIIIKS